MKSLFNDIQSEYKMRFYPKQKERFRQFICEKFKGLGYENITIDNHKNIIVGDINCAKKVVSAHYDTPPLSFYITPFTRIFGHIAGTIISSLFLIFFLFFCSTIIFALLNVSSGDLSFSIVGFLPILLLFFFPNPNNANDNTSGVVTVFEVAKRLANSQNIGEYAFVLFNNEEWGLLGSAGLKKSYSKNNSKMPNFELYNLDCVGLGSKLLIASKEKSDLIMRVVGIANLENIDTMTIKANIFTVASDILLFSNAVMLTGVKKSIFGPFYLPKIHMPNDNKFDDNFAKKVADIVTTAIESES